MITYQMDMPKRADQSPPTDARLAVIGLGYVGLPLATAAAQVGIAVTGIDLDRSKVDALNKGDSPIVLQSATYPRTTEEVVLPILERSGFKAGVDFGFASHGLQTWAVR